MCKYDDTESHVLAFPCVIIKLLFCNETVFKFCVKTRCSVCFMEAAPSDGEAAQAARAREEEEEDWRRHARGLPARARRSSDRDVPDA